MAHSMRKSHNYRWTTKNQFWARLNQYFASNNGIKSIVWIVRRWLDIILFFLHSRLDWFIFGCFIDINNTVKTACTSFQWSTFITWEFIDLYLQQKTTQLSKKKKKNKGDNKRFNMTFNKRIFFLIRFF